ncbi:MAG: FlgO family outer membrane protein [bacterium]|nr:FlgO family outer membrane protein [bacterium]
MKRNQIIFLIILSLLVAYSSLIAGGKWYNYYEDGLKEMQTGNWAKAIENFKEAVKIQYQDTKKIKTYGMHFIEYFPHREIGICFYHLGKNDVAERELRLSLQHEYSARAQEYLAKVSGQPFVQMPIQTPVKPVEEKKITPPPPPVVTPPEVIHRVGERMGLAVLPFQTKGLGTEMGEINVVEQMMTTFFNLNRFKLFERTQLEKILEEQKLGMAGVLDASTAAEIGKGIGVDAIVLGTVTRAGANIAIDARLIDTETAEIITAQDEISARTSIQDLKDMINKLALKISQDLPLVEGYVISVGGDRLTLDIGGNNGLKKGMKCIVYHEGKEIIHPITKKVLGKETEELGEIKLNQVFPEYSVGQVIKTKSGVFEVGNKIITK